MSAALARKRYASCSLRSILEPRNHSSCRSLLQSSWQDGSKGRSDGSLLTVGMPPEAPIGVAEGLADFNTSDRLGPCIADSSGRRLRRVGAQARPKRLPA